MRALVQRVTSASVTSDGELTGSIDAGLCVFVGATNDDDSAKAEKLAAKVAKLRIFDDEAGVMNRSVLDVGGSVLVVSQFTLYADTAKGNRPSYIAAARPHMAEPLCERVVDALRALDLTVETGRFRTDMQITLTNDGPVTISLEV